MDLQVQELKLLLLNELILLFNHLIDHNITEHLHLK